jgi:hypothetical protein
VAAERGGDARWLSRSMFGSERDDVELCFMQETFLKLRA